MGEDTMKSPLENKYLAADDLLLIPRKGILNSRSDATLNPFLYSAPMDRVTGYWLSKKMLELNEIPVISRFLNESERQRCLFEFHSSPAFFAIGGTKEHLLTFINELKVFDDENPTTFYINVAIDIAHGHSEIGLEAIRFLRNNLPCVNHIMSGSIATSAAAMDSIQAGATHLRVGIGPGSMCTTRIMTGIGIPNISAVYRIKQTVNSQAYVIADGGIKSPGDAVKYLAAGADGIMMGHEFSKTFEAPGWEIEEPDYRTQMLVCGPMAEQMPKAYIKTYRGQASAEFQKDQTGQASWCPEGASSKEISWEGDTVESVIMKYRGGISSALSYLGLKSMHELHPNNVEFIEISPAARIESLDHANLK
jgi:IMP dehydrogenase/GMP reductase